MITLALQIFLLLLSAYLVGCMTGCLLRRSLHTSRAVPARAGVAAQALPEPLPPPDATLESVRFQKALTGGDAAAPAVRRTEPVVEVRARPVPLAPLPGDYGTAEIDIVPVTTPAPTAATTRVELDLPPPPPELEAVAEAVAPPAVEVVEVIAETAAPAVAEPEPIAAPEPEPEPEPEVVIEPEVVAEPEAAPEPAPPVSTAGAATIASYAAVAAAAAAAAQAAERAPEPDIAPALEPEPVVEPEPEIAAPPEPLIEAAPEPEAIVEAEPEAIVEAEPEAIAQPEPETPVAPPAAEPADDLKRIRGIDRVLEERLNGAGVARFAEIANWSADDVGRFNQTLGLSGRIEQENWIEQAQILARGSETAYARRRRIEEVTVAAGVAAAAASAAASATAQQSAGPDRFTRIIGIDAETEQALYRMGYTRYSELAHWTSTDIELVEAELGRPGRVGLDNWVEQARVLARYAGETEPRPVRLADAIRENRESRATAEPARTDLAGLRSVRSQALRGEGRAPGERTDDLKRIRGVGVLIEKRLNAAGIVSYEQIANWTGADIDSISSLLDFKGRIERENWIEQARILASGGQTEFSRRVDRGEVESSRDS